MQLHSKTSVERYGFVYPKRLWSSLTYLSPQDSKPISILYFFLPEPRSTYMLWKCLLTWSKHTGTYLSAWRPQVRTYLIPERTIWSDSGELYKIVSATLSPVWLHVLKEGKMPNALGKVTKYRYLPSKVWANVYLGWCVCKKCTAELI